MNFYSFGDILVGVLLVTVLAQFFTLMNLKERVRKLELGGVSNTEDSRHPVVARATSFAQPGTVSVAAATPVSGTDSAGSRFARWLKEDWLLKLGALLLLIGFGWLTTYAFLNNWVGPVGRIALGMGAGALILAFGWHRMGAYRHQGGIFVVLGATVVLLTTFAAREVYGFFTPGTALGLMFAVAVFVALASVVRQSKALAVAGLIFASLAPLMTDAPNPNYISLFAYLLVVMLGTLWVVGVRGWRELTTVGTVIMILYSVPHLSSFVQSDTGALLLFIYIFSGIFFVATVAGIIHTPDGTKVTADAATAGGSGLLLLAWIYSAVAPEWQSLVIVFWTLVFLTGAFIVLKRTGRREPFYVYGGVGVVMLAAATNAELSGTGLVIAYAIEACVLYCLAHGFFLRSKGAEDLLALYAVPVALSVPSLASLSLSVPLFTEHNAVLAVLALVFFITLLYRNIKVVAEQSRSWDKTLIIFGSLYAYALVWQALHAPGVVVALAPVLGNIGYDVGTIMALTCYTVIGLIVYIRGRRTDSKGMRLYGGTLLGIVVIRLMVIDVWNMALAGRIVTFFVVGTLLVTTAFFGRKKPLPVTTTSQ